MHVRFSMVIGMPVVEDQADTTLGIVSGILLHPDTGVIVGFFVRDLRMFGGSEYFLSVADIIGWGTVIHVRSEEKLALPQDIVRLSALLDDPRRVLGQKILTRQSRRSIGRCQDVQFDTRHFQLEWLFPKAWWFFSRTPVPASDVIEITEEGILVREQVLSEPAMKQVQELDLSLPDVLPSTTMQCKRHHNSVN